MRKLLARLRKNRITALFLGFFLIAIGLVLSLPGVPGPGLAIVFLGLVVLSDHYHWAKRMTDWVQRKWARIWPGSTKPDGPKPPGAAARE